MISDDGVTRVDLHLKILNDDVVCRAKQAGLDVLVYAPHFTHLTDVREQAARYSDDDLLVVPARECFTGVWNQRRHVLVVDPSDPIPDFLTFEATMSELNEREETVLAPHPTFLTMSLSGADIRDYSDVFDAVEVFCPKNWWFHSRRMAQIAAETGLATYASSYAHLTQTVGEVWVEFDTTIESASELCAALKTGVERRCLRNGGLGHLLKRRAEFAHLSKENTWDKLRRVAFEHPEATNPTNGRYDDRYRDSSAY